MKFYVLEGEKQFPQWLIKQPVQTTQVFQTLSGKEKWQRREGQGFNLLLLPALSSIG